MCDLIFIFIYISVSLYLFCIRLWYNQNFSMIYCLKVFFLLQHYTIGKWYCTKFLQHKRAGKISNMKEQANLGLSAEWMYVNFLSSKSFYYLQKCCYACDLWFIHSPTLWLSPITYSLSKLLLFLPFSSDLHWESKGTYDCCCAEFVWLLVLWVCIKWKYEITP